MRDVCIDTFLLTIQYELTIDGLWEITDYIDNLVFQNKDFAFTDNHCWILR